MNQPQTPDNDVALSESVWGAYWPDWESRAKAMKMACEKLEEEVDRLRGLLKDHATFLRKNGFDRQADDLMRHAPAPEEPVIKESLITEPVPEWRELGPDEVPQIGDEMATPPRTDAEILRLWKGKIAAYVSVDFARELERELSEKTNEVARLREWKERAEKAEALIQQLHHFAGIIEGFQTNNK